jgi:hypothetical protein
MNNITDNNYMSYINIYNKLNNINIETINNINTYNTKITNLYNTIENTDISNNDNELFKDIIKKFNNFSINFNDNKKDEKSKNNTLYEIYSFTILNNIDYGKILYKYLNILKTTNIEEFENILDDIKLKLEDDLKLIFNKGENKNSNDHNIKNISNNNYLSFLKNNSKIRLFLNTCLYDDIVLDYIKNFKIFLNKINIINKIFNENNLLLDNEFYYKSVKMYLCLIFNINMINELNYYSLFKYNKLGNIFDILSSYKYKKIYNDKNKLINVDNNLMFFICISYSLIDSLIDEQKYLELYFKDSLLIKKVGLDNKKKLFKKIKLIILHYIYLMIEQIKYSIDKKNKSINSFLELLNILKKTKSNLDSFKFEFIYIMFENIINNQNNFSDKTFFDYCNLSFNKATIHELIFKINYNIKNNSKNSNNSNNSNNIKKILELISIKNTQNNIFFKTIKILNIFLSSINVLLANILDSFIYNINKLYLEYINLIYILDEIKLLELNCNYNEYDYNEYNYNEYYSYLNQEIKYNFNKTHYNFYEYEFANILVNKIQIFLKFITYSLTTEIECHQNQSNITDKNNLVNLTNKKGLSTLYLLYISLLDNTNDIINNIFLKSYKLIKTINTYSEYDKKIKIDLTNMSDIYNLNIINFYLPFNKSIDKILLDQYYNINKSNKAYNTFKMTKTFDINILDDNIKKILIHFNETKIFIDYTSIFTQFLDDLSDYKSDLREKIITSSCYYLLNKKKKKTTVQKLSNIFKKIKKNNKAININEDEYNLINQNYIEKNIGHFNYFNSESNDKLIDNFNRMLFLNIQFFNILTNNFINNLYDNNNLYYENNGIENNNIDNNFIINNRLKQRFKKLFIFYKYYLLYIIMKYKKIISNSIKELLIINKKTENTINHILDNKIKYKTLINNIDKN